MLENIYGTVIKITYFNENNGFGIVRIKLNYQDNKIAKYRAKLFTNQLTVTCNFERKPILNEEYDFTGEFVNTDYGIQFKAKSFSRRAEDTLEGVVTYLSSDFFPGIGKVTATKVYEQIGKNCLEEIENDKTVLDTIEGLTDSQKETIYNSIIENKSKKKITIGLLNFGITMQTSLKLMKTLGDNALNIIKSNPYQLIDLVEGFGFIRADKIAIETGIEKDAPIRIQAMIMYIVSKYTYYSGNTYIEYSILLNKCIEEFNKDTDILNKNNFEEALDELVKNGKIFIDEEKNVFDSYIYQSENIVAKNIYRLLNEDFDCGYNINEIDSALKKATEKNKIVYSEKQIFAIKSALSENIVIITGGPGTGKSTIIKGIIETYVELYKKEYAREDIALIAPTGRAAKRLKEVTGHENSQTIHRFLGFEGHGVFRHDESNPVEAKLVIVDEVSMVDIILANKLFSSLPEGCKIVLVGDADQLPSVGPGQLLQNLISSKEITTITLDKIHRQAEGSTIISLAHSINNGILPNDIMEKKHDRNFIPLRDEDIIDNVIKVVHQALNKGMDIIKDIQVLVPLYKGENGINALNERMQREFNPFVDYELKHLTRVFRVNDKVIQLVNRNEKQVMNGDIGVVFSFNFENENITGLNVLFDSGLVSYNKDELEDLTHAFAISIHKAQGSEFDLVIVPFTFKYFIMLKRKLIYTAVTRAKKYLIMLGNIEAVNKGIVGIEENRKTRLVEKIKKLFDGQKLIIDEIQNWPKDLENVSPYDFM